MELPSGAQVRRIKKEWRMEHARNVTYVLDTGEFAFSVIRHDEGGGDRGRARVAEVNSPPSQRAPPLCKAPCRTPTAKGNKGYCYRGACSV